MLKKVLLWLFVWIPWQAGSQHFIADWQQCYGGSGIDMAYDILPVSNGFLVFGSTASDDGDVEDMKGLEDFWLIRLDSVGNLIWEKTFGGSESEYAGRIVRIGLTNDFYLTGSTFSDDGDITENNYPGTLNYWIVKVDADGNIYWNKLTGGSGAEFSDDAVISIDDGVVVNGNTSSSDGDVSDFFGYWDAWIVEVNPDGSTDQDFTIGTDQGTDYGQSIILTNDSHYLAGAYSIINGQGNIECPPHSSNAEAAIFKLDSNFNVIWHRCYGGTGDEGVMGIIEIADGYLFSLTGGSGDGDLAGSGWHGAKDIWLVKTDFDGSIIWQKCFGGSADEYARRIFSTTDGDIVVIGTTFSQDGDISFNPSLDESRSSIWVLKVNSEGQLLWEQCLGGSGSESVRFGAAQLSDQEYIIAGCSNLSPSFDVNCDLQFPGNSNPDFWILKISDTSTVLVKESGGMPFQELKIIPNPSNGYFEISCNIGDLSKNKGIMQISDISGREIIRSGFDGKISSNEMPYLFLPGVYFCTLQFKDVFISRKVLILQ